jgi:hypothetical protein
MKMKGSCHCQKVRFEAEGETAGAIVCNCSICQRKGSILAFVPADKFQLLSGQDNLTDYQFGKKTIHHYFCSTCGVTSFASGSTPDGTQMRAINLRCVEGIDLDQLNPHKVDGRSF